MFQGVAGKEKLRRRQGRHGRDHPLHGVEFGKYNIRANVVLPGLITRDDGGRSPAKMISGYHGPRTRSQRWDVRRFEASRAFCAAMLRRSSPGETINVDGG